MEERKNAYLLEVEAFHLEAQANCLELGVEGEKVVDLDRRYLFLFREDYDKYYDWLSGRERRRIIGYRAAYLGCRAMGDARRMIKGWVERWEEEVIHITTN